MLVATAEDHLVSQTLNPALKVLYIELLGLANWIRTIAPICAPLLSRQRGPCEQNIVFVQYEIGRDWVSMAPVPVHCIFYFLKLKRSRGEYLWCCMAIWFEARLA